ncbi:MAG: PAS domain-containing protein [Nitrospirota bacterium]
MGKTPPNKESEQILRELKSAKDALYQYRSMVDNSMDAIFLTAPDGKVFFANQAACDLFEMTAQEIIAGGRDSVLDTKDPRLPKALEERLRAGKFRGELNLKKKDGTIFPGEVSSLIFIDSQGQQLTSMVVRDISAQKKLEKDLAASEMWMRCIFNSLEEAVFVVSAERYLVNINNAAERMFRYSAEELTGKSTELLHVDSRHYEEFGKLINESFDSGETANFEFQMKRKNGELFPSEHNVSLLKDKGGNITGIVSVVRDISKIKQIEQEREKLISDLQKSLIEIRKLSGLLPICANCKKIRDDKGCWRQIDEYISEHSEAEFSHGICPECVKKIYPYLDINGD